MNPVPLNIIEWHLFLLVVSALSNWFLSDWQLGLRCSRQTAAWTGDCSKATLCLCLIRLECICSDWSNLHGPEGESICIFTNCDYFLFYFNDCHLIVILVCLDKKSNFSLLSQNISLCTLRAGLVSLFLKMWWKVFYTVLPSTHFCDANRRKYYSYIESQIALRKEKSCVG